MHYTKQFIYTVFTICILVSMPATAQKRECAEARTLLKQNKSLDKAEKIMRGVIAMPEQSGEIEHRLLLADIIRKQYENNNEKLYLRQLSDTATLFPTLRKLFIACLDVDSIDAKPDSKGKVKTKYRRKNAEFLNRLRPNLYSGCKYLFAHKKYADAYSCIDTYINTADEPLFDAYKYADRDTIMNEAAYWGVVSALRSDNYFGMRKHEERALKYKPQRHHLLAMLYDKYIAKGDSTSAVKYLKIGFRDHSEYPFFFPRLVDFYSQRNQLDTVAVIVNQAVTIEPGNMFYRLALNNLQLNQGDYDNCIALGDSLLRSNDKLAEAYFNVGSAYFNKALQYGQKHPVTRDRRKVLSSLYEKSLPYLERYRLLRKKDKQRWAPMLYTVYLELNKGKEFEEIDRIIRSENIEMKK